MFYVIHGGKCCGIKTIYGMTTNPNYICMARDVVAAARDNGARLAFVPAGNKLLVREPAETSTQKLDRYLGYNDMAYPSGVLEIVLADSKHDCFNQKAWIPILLERGFLPVTENLNSNSLNTITIYHRRLLKGVIQPPELAEKVELARLARLAKDALAPKPKPKPKKEVW